ncbi:MAG: doxx family protein [Rhodopirellula sp.]|nr:doxx family protein [Rhodopirellula sp.]
MDELITPSESSNNQRSPDFLRISLGLLFFYFGFLKFYPDLSPAEMIAGQTLTKLLMNWSEVRATLVCLAILECWIGVALVLNLLPRTTFVLFLIHMTGTFLPLFLLPEFTFKFAPFAPTLEGQYILKNLVFVAAGWTVLQPKVFPRGVQWKSGTARSVEVSKL